MVSCFLYALCAVLVPGEVLAVHEVDASREACLQFDAAVSLSAYTTTTTTTTTTAAKIYENEGEPPIRSNSRNLDQAVLWSSVECGAQCIVPAGETWILDESATLATLTIRGTLQWDTTKEGLELRAGYVLVEDGGHFELGTATAPMELRATIHISKGPHVHPHLGKRFFGGIGSARIDIHGRRLARTWSL